MIWIPRGGLGQAEESLLTCSQNHWLKAYKGGEKDEVLFDFSKDLNR